MLIGYQVSTAATGPPTVAWGAGEYGFIGDTIAVTANATTGDWQESDDGSTGWTNIAGETDDTGYVQIAAHEGKFISWLDDTNGRSNVLDRVWVLSDWTSIVAWWDGADTSTLTESGGDISQWDDKSGNSKHATQGDAADQPATGVNTLNGRNVITFDEEYFELPDDMGLSGADNRLVFGVARAQASDNLSIYSMGTGTGARWTFIYTNTGLLRVAIHGDGTTSSLDAGADWHLVGADLNGTDLEDVTMFLGDATEDAGAGGTLNTSADNNALGGRQAAGLDPLQGDIAEMVFGGLPSAGELAKIQGYLAHRWSLTSDLDAGHTYKSTPPLVSA